MAERLTVSQLAEALGLPAPAEGGERPLVGVHTLQDAGAEHLSFFDNQLYKEGARTTQAGAVLVREADAALLPETVVALLTTQPYVAMAKALALFHPESPVTAGISAQAVVSDKAEVHPTARVEPGAVVYAGAKIGAGVQVGAHAVIGENVTVGEGTRIGAHCTVVKGTIGARCILHPGVCVGSDGFGFAVDGEQILKVPQVGSVIIGNDVEIGAGTTIDCGALDDTVIEDMVKLDNQVQIGHNVRLGRGSRVVAQTGISGSTQVGAFTVIGGQVGIAGHIRIADKVMIAARSGVSKSIETVGAIMAGVPAEPIADWRRKVAMVSRLAKMPRKKQGDS